MPPSASELPASTSAVQFKKPLNNIITQVDFQLNKDENAARNTLSWSEIEKHNKYNDCWIVSHGKVYDVSEWAKRHPGGDIILLGGGLDVTIQMESYHVRGIESGILKKYCIGVVDKPKSETYYDWSSEFYPTLRSRVMKALADSNRSRRGGASMILKTLIIMTLWSFSWYYTFVQGSYIAAILFGFMSSQIGVSVMHDGSHGAFSALSPAIGKIASYGMDIIGSSSTCWEYQHIMGHHPFTNLDSQSNRYENDPDTFSSYPFVKMHPRDGVKASWYMKYQHIYAPVLFAMFTMAKVIYVDFGYVTDSKVGYIDMTSRLSDPWCMIRFVTFKIVTLIAHVGVGCYFHGIGKGLALIGLAHLVCGEFLALMFIVTHISEDCTFLDDQHKPELVKTQQKLVSGRATKSAGDTDWAALQCLTSTNWAVDSWFWTHVSGGLNHQIEHHLFPGICHLNYPTIRSAVQETCAEFGVPYHAHKTLGTAIQAMLNQLYISARVDDMKKTE